MKVAGRWRYVYRALDEHGQIIDVYVSSRRDTQAARRFFATALRDHGEPTEVVTDRACALLAVVDELMPGAFHTTDQYANIRKADHERLTSRLRPMRGLECDRTARVIMHSRSSPGSVTRQATSHPGQQAAPEVASREPPVQRVFDHEPPM
jgi:transposase-like protein